MHGAETRLHLQCKLPATGWSVNGLIQALTMALRELPQQLVWHLMDEYQRWLFDAALGPPYHPVPEPPRTPWHCPGCGIQRGFRRKGRRHTPRRLRSSLGPLAFPLYQVQCHCCGRVFPPVLQLLRLPAYAKLAQELEETVCALASELPYARGMRLLARLTGVRVSPRTAHRKVQQYGAQCHLEPQLARPRVIYCDSTKVPAGTPERGVDLHLALTVTRRGRHAGRPQNTKALLGFGVATRWEGLLKPLQRREAQTVVSDGDPGVEGAVSRHWPQARLQRCHWHLVHQLDHFLYRDGLLKPAHDHWLNRLQAILGDHQASLVAAHGRYRALLGALRHCGHWQAFTHLHSAEAAVFTYKTLGGSHSVVTSLVEREMRELNRRTDVGARWSIPGVRNVLALRLAQRFAHPAWDGLWEHVPAQLELRVEPEKVKP